MMAYFKFTAQFTNFFIFRRSSIIRDNDLRDTVPTNDLVQNELGDYRTRYSGKRHGLYPFGEIFSGRDYKIMAVCRRVREFPY